MITAYLAEVCRLYVLAALLAAVTGKTLGFPAFRRSVEALTGVPATVSLGVAGAVVAAEAGAATLMLAGGVRAWLGLAIALLLFTVFTGVVALALARRRQVGCNCFGWGQRDLSAWDLLRNALLIGGCCAALIGPPIDAALEFSAWAALAGTALILLMVTVHLDEIAFLAGPARI